MLLAFSVQNFKSIRDLQTLSLEARSDEHLAWSHVVTDGKLRVVKSAVLYGANASGKSNVIEALVWFRKFVLTSSKEGQAGEDIQIWMQCRNQSEAIESAEAPTIPWSRVVEPLSHIGGDAVLQCHARGEQVAAIDSQHAITIGLAPEAERAFAQRSVA